MELKDLKAKGVRVIALDMPYMSDWNKANDNSIYGYGYRHCNNYKGSYSTARTRKNCI